MRREACTVMPTLTPEQRDTLHREVRAVDPDVWEPACQRLGELAAFEQEAYTALCDMLLSSSAELRLRGLVALRTLAPVRPDDVSSFLAARVEESRTLYDPILLDAILFVYAALPNEVGQPLVQGYLSDSSEVVRAAAAAALPFWSNWPVGTLTRLAQDPSSLVKAGLLTALAHLEEGGEKAQASEILSQCQDPHLRGLLEELHNGPVGGKPNLWPEPLEEKEVDEILHSRRELPVRLTRLGQSLSTDPESTLRQIREGLSEPKMERFLEELSELAGEPELSGLLRAWSRMVGGSGGGTSASWMLGVLGCLEAGPEVSIQLPLQEFVKACYQAADCRDVDSLLTWCCAHQVNLATLSVWNPEQLQGLSLAPEAQQCLSDLAELGVNFQDSSLVQFSHFEQELEQFSDRLIGECPLPERFLVRAVVEEWQTLLERETEQMMGGGEL